MTTSIVQGRNPFPPTTQTAERPTRMQWGVNALSAPTTPDKRMAVVDRANVDPTIRKAAEGMEGMFIDYMMQVMRQTVPKNDMDLESPATGIYRGMLDSEYAAKAAQAGGIGLADQIIAYIESQRYNRIGGNHEGQPDGK